MKISTYNERIEAINRSLRENMELTEAPARTLKGGNLSSVVRDSARRQYGS